VDVKGDWLRDVIEESSQVAYTVARARLDSTSASSSYFDNSDVHIHVPDGGAPKYESSAGVIIITILLSIALGKPARNYLGLRGEISLTWKVLSVGGIKEKTMVARRAGIKCIAFPARNQHDFDEMPEYLEDVLSVHFADFYSTVSEVAVILVSPTSITRSQTLAISNYMKRRLLTKTCKNEHRLWLKVLLFAWHMFTTFEGYSIIQVIHEYTANT